MSITSKIQEVLAANPGVSWNDLVLRRLRTATSSTNGALNDLWMRWLATQGYTLGSLQDRMMAYWRANNTPLSERNAFYFGYSAFFAITVPGAPTMGTATAGNGQATVTFTPPGSDGGSPITGYRVTSNPGGITATGAGSPITVTGLSNGTAYTFTVQAQNAVGFSVASAASNSVTPVAPTFLLQNTSIPAGSILTGVRLQQNGSANTVIGAGYGVNMTNQWVSTGATSTIGNGYEAVATIITGTNSTNIDGLPKSLDQDRNFLLQDSTGGSFSLLIRVAGGGATVAGPVTITVS